MLGKVMELENKLRKYEAIEMDLGIPLEVLFKALKQVIYGLNRENEIEHLYTPRLYFVKDYECYCLREGIFLCEDDFKLKDYGKTWALTREELENAKD